MFPKTLPIRFTVLGLFFLISGLTASLILGIQYQLSKELAYEAVQDNYTHLANQTGNQLNTLDRESINLINLLELSPEILSPLHSTTLHPSIPYLTRIMQQHPMLHSLYIGHENGDMLQIIQAKESTLKERLKLLESCRWIVTMVTGAGSLRRQTTRQLDENLTTIHQSTIPSKMDSTTQPWYQKAVIGAGIQKTEPYLLTSLGKPGITYMRSIKDTFKVIGLDISLQSLSQFLAEQHSHSHSEFFMFQEDGSLLASGQSIDESMIQKALSSAHWNIKLSNTEQQFIQQHPIIRISNRSDLPPYDYMQSGKPQGYSVGLLQAVSSQLGIKLEFVNGYTWEELVQLFRLGKIDMLHALHQNEVPENIGLWSKPYIQPQAESEPLHLLISYELPILVPLFDKALNSAPKDVIEKLKNKWLKSSSAHTQMERLPYDELLKISKTHDPSKHLHTFVREGKSYLGYVAQLDSQTGMRQYLGVQVSLDEILSPYQERIWIALWISLGLLMLLTPIVWWGTRLIVHPIKLLALENHKVKHRDFAKIGKVSSRITEIAELSDSIVSMARSIEAYQKAQRELMDSFIRVVAAAIDQKSPYTGGHCRRVPKLATMLAKKAAQSQEEGLAEFSFKTDDEWWEFRTGAWLHDCGKVTTPEYVVDKATKLETIYNRIHEIRTRFEVLWRDAEIEYWQALQEEGADESRLRQILEERHNKIREDFEFVASCNLGGENMDDTQIARLHKISRQTWVRHLDNRLGLSRLELERCPQPLQPLPITEFLLDDKPEHRIVRHDDGSQNWNSQEVFPLPIPLYRLHLGELHNLCVRRGTLTLEERYIINEHIISTIRMLETLPFPEYLARIPEYAGSHHETLDGTGYPRRLEAKELSIPSRILAIADVFEALTASDRPYKDGKKLSEAIAILHKMSERRHIDPVLFRLFLRSNVHLEYARKYLRPEQIDDVNISQYLDG